MGEYDLGDEEDAVQHCYVDKYDCTYGIFSNIHIVQDIDWALQPQIPLKSTK